MIVPIVDAVAQRQACHNLVVAACGNLVDALVQGSHILGRNAATILVLHKDMVLVAYAVCILARDADIGGVEATTHILLEGSFSLVYGITQLHEVDGRVCISDDWIVRFVGVYRYIYR